MKPSSFFYLIFVSFLLLTQVSHSKTNKKIGNNLDFDLIETNLLEGLDSDNLGLRVSSAHYLGEYKSEKAVIPLLKMLHQEKEEGARIQAALSLIKIGDEKGINIVRKASKFDESARVRNMCAKFYNAYKRDKAKN